MTHWNLRKDRYFFCQTCKQMGYANCRESDMTECEQCKPRKKVQKLPMKKLLAKRRSEENN